MRELISFHALTTSSNHLFKATTLYLQRLSLNDNMLELTCVADYMELMESNRANRQDKLLRKQSTYNWEELDVLERVEQIFLQAQK